jgi:hypothetical protein
MVGIPDKASGHEMAGDLRTGSASSSSYPDGHIDDLAAQVGNVLANVFGTELVCRTVEILRQLHADVVRAWLRAPVA